MTKSSPALIMLSVILFLWGPALYGFEALGRKHLRNARNPPRLLPADSLYL